MQNQLKKPIKKKQYSRWSYSTSSLFNSPYSMAKTASCTTLPKFSEIIYAR